MTLITSVLAAIALAGPPEGPGTLVSIVGGGVFGGYLESGGNKFTYGGAITPFFDEHVGLEFEVASTPDLFVVGEDTRVTTFTSSLFLRTSFGRRVSGHLAIGLGGVRSSLYVRNRGEQAIWHPCAAAGAGATIDFSRHFGARLDLKYLSAVDEEGELAEFDRTFGSMKFGRATAGVFMRL